MKYCQIPRPEAIRSMRESIKAGWDVKTKAGRRISAVSRQRDLARRFGLRLQFINAPEATIKSCVA